MNKLIDNTNYEIIIGDKNYLYLIERVINDDITNFKIIGSTDPNSDVKLVQYDFEFKDLPHEVLLEIVQMQSSNKEFLVGEPKITYFPYIREHYEDADEFFRVEFEGLCMGSRTAIYTLELRPTLDVHMWYDYQNEGKVVFHVVNQNDIQSLLSNYFLRTINKIDFKESLSVLIDLIEDGKSHTKSVNEVIEMFFTKNYIIEVENDVVVIDNNEIKFFVI